MAEATQPKDESASALSILYQVLLALGTLIIFLVVYELIRTSEFGKKIYAPRKILLPDQAPEVSEGWFKWIKENAKIDDDYILWNNGLDAVMCLKIFRMGYKMFLGIFIVVAIITIPINIVHRDRKNLYKAEEVNSTTAEVQIKFLNTSIPLSKLYKEHEQITPMYIRNENTGIDLLNQNSTLANNENPLNVDMDELKNSLRNLNFTDENNEVRKLNEEEVKFIVENVKFDVVANETGNSTEDGSSETSTTGAIIGKVDKIKNFLKDFNIQHLFFGCFKEGREAFSLFHVVAVYFVVIYICYVLFKTYQEYLVLLEKYIREGGVIQENNYTGEILQHSTIMIRNIPQSLQDEEKLTNWFNKLGIGKIENVIIARSSEDIKAEIENRNKILGCLETAYAQWINNIKNEKPTTDGILTKTIKSLIRNDDDDIMAELYQEEKDKYRPKHFIKKFGIIPIKHVDTIYYYENELLKITKNVRDMRFEAAESKKWSQTAFVTFSNQQAAKIAAQLILYSSQNPSVMSGTTAPHPNDLIYSNLTMHTEQKTYRSLIIYVAMYFVCFIFVTVVLITNYETLKGLTKNIVGVKEIFTFIDETPALSALTSLINVLLVNAYMSLVPYILRFLSNFQGFESKSDYCISILRKYYLFLMINVLFVFSISSMSNLIFDTSSINPEGTNTDSTEKIGDDTDINTDMNIKELLNKITVEFINNSITLLNYGILRLQSFGFEIFRIGPFIMGILGKFLTKSSPRGKHESEHASTPPDYSILLAIPMICYAIFTIFSVINPFISLVGLLYFLIGYHILKNQFIYVYIKEYEAQGHYFITVFNRIIVALLLFEIFMIGDFLIAIGYNKPYGYLLIPTPIITIYFYNYCHRCFKPRTDNVPADLLITKEQNKKYSNVYKRTDIFGRSDSILSLSFSSEADTFISCASHVTSLDHKSPSEILKYSERQVHYLPPYYEAKSYYNPALTDCLYSPWLPEEAESVLSKQALNHVSEICKNCIRCDKESKTE